METKAKIPAKKSAPKLLAKNNLLLVRPSCGNMHKFVAQEDSCFFDICLPNYNGEALRRITYFNEVAEHVGCDGHEDEHGEHAPSKSNTPPRLQTFTRARTQSPLPRPHPYAPMG